jgi:hypothetical protein
MSSGATSPAVITGLKNNTGVWATIATDGNSIKAQIMVRRRCLFGEADIDNIAAVLRPQ